MGQLREEQKEFFQEFGKPKKGIERLMRRYIPSKRFFVTLSIENMVLSTITVIMVVVAAFSLGVERGKRIARTEKIKVDIESREAGAADVAPKETIMPELLPKETPKEKEEAPKKAKVLVKKKGKYAIQVVSFKNEARAKKKIEEFKEDGFDAFIIPAENWFQICVGRYATTEEAKTDLNRLKADYKDCFIRKTGSN
jgi:cell division protein FtsN